MWAFFSVTVQNFDPPINTFLTIFYPAFKIYMNFLFLRSISITVLLQGKQLSSLHNPLTAIITSTAPFPNLPRHVGQEHEIYILHDIYRIHANDFDLDLVKLWTQI